MVQVTVETSKTVQRKADDRGRVRLGPEYADCEVEVAILSTSERDAETCEN